MFLKFGMMKLDRATPEEGGHGHMMHFNCESVSLAIHLHCEVDLVGGALLKIFAVAVH